MKPTPRLRSGLARLGEDRSGATAVVTGLLLATTLGFVGLGTDLGVAYAQRRSAQSAADSAAFSAAVGSMAGVDDVTDQARTIAATYGFAHAAQGVQVAVYQPARTGPQAGNPKSVEVVISKPMTRFLSGLFSQEAATIRARAVAVAGAAGDTCILSLNPSISGAITNTGTTDVNLVGCSMRGNSTSASAMDLKGGASVRAKSVGLAGGLAQGNNVSLTTTEGVRTRQPPIPDPYSQAPDYSDSGRCNQNSAAPAGNVTYTALAEPYVFCNGLTINSQTTVTLTPGVYVIDRGALLVNGGGSLIARNGVSIFLTGSGSNFATVDIRGGATVEIDAPVAGDTAGLAIYQDRSAPGYGSNDFNGGSSQRITGALYFPSQAVNYSGGSTAGQGCTQLVANQITFKGNSQFEINCLGTGVKSLGGLRTALVE